MMSLKTMLAEMLRNYKLTTDIRYEDMEFKFKVSMHLAFDHRVFLELRNLYGWEEVEEGEKTQLEAISEV